MVHTMIDIVLHRTLKVPYTLAVGKDKKVQNPRATVVFLHGLGRTSEVWNDIIADMAKERVRCISLDLLGFGESPQPGWKTYDAKSQASAVAMTLMKLRVKQPLILVGHSLGGLVAAEFGLQYPKQVASLIICSAPIYRSETAKIAKHIPVLTGGEIHKVLLKNLRKRKDFTKSFNYYARKVKFVDEDFVVDESNINAVVQSIEMAIENQSAYDDITKLKVPTTLMYGRLDPYIVKRHFKAVAKSNDHCTVEAVMAGHEVTLSQRYTDAVKEQIRRHIAKGDKNSSSKV